MNAASGYVVSSLHRVKKSLFRAINVSAWGGIYTAVIIIEENSLGRYCGRHLIVRNSKSGEQKDLSSCMLLWSYHVSLIIRHSHPPLLLPERCLFLSARCVEKPAGCTDSDSVSWVSHVSVKQRTLQSLMSLWMLPLLGFHQPCCQETITPMKGLLIIAWILYCTQNYGKLIDIAICYMGLQTEIMLTCKN